MTGPSYMPDQKKEKKERKYSPYFLKSISFKRVMIQGVPKIFRLIFHTLAHLDQSVWLVSPLGPFFDLAIIYETSMPNYFIPTQKKPTKSFVVGRMKRKASSLWWGYSYTLRDREHHMRNLFYFEKKTLENLQMQS